MDLPSYLPQRRVWNNALCYRATLQLHGDPGNLPDVRATASIAATRTFCEPHLCW